MVVNLILGKKKLITKNKTMPYNNSPAKKYGPLKMDNDPKTETRVKVKDNETGKVTMLTKKNGQYYRAGQRVELTPSQSPIEKKGSPYMMYGQEKSPMMMKGESPLAKYGCTRK